MRTLIGIFLGGVLAMGGVCGSSEERSLLPVAETKWRLVTDGVMGGVSVGEMRVGVRGGKASVCLTGNVRTENNGGFIQIALDLEAGFAAQASDYDGLTMAVLGNGEQYNMHLRTSDLWLPWQSYRAGFASGPEWRTVRLPFAEFEPYKTGSTLRPVKLRRIGIVAIGRAFAADICVAGLAFYRDRES